MLACVMLSLVYNRSIQPAADKKTNNSKTYDDDMELMMTSAIAVHSTLNVE